MHDQKTNGIHPSLRDCPDDDELSPLKVKEWIRTQKKLLSAAQSDARQKVKGAPARVANHEGYIRNMQKYLRDGDWVDNFFGEKQERRMGWRCYALAYDEDGNAKRDVGTFYPDMGMVYTQKMFDEDNFTP